MVAPAGCTGCATPRGCTDEAQFPLWAPDSRSIGFFSRDKLRRFDLDGVGARTIATAPNGRGGAWSQNGTISLSPNLSSRLWRVAATGDIRSGNESRSLPSGCASATFRSFFRTVVTSSFSRTALRRKDPALKIGTLDDPSHMQEIPELAGNAFQAVFAPSGHSTNGHLIYVKERALVAQRFNTRTLRLEGEPYTVVSRQSFNVSSSPGFLNLTVSSTGTLLDGGAQRARNELAWRKRDGTLLQVLGEENG